MKSAIFSLLSSSCCLIQVFLNYLQYPCAGFSILTPYRTLFLSLTILSLTISIRKHGLTASSILSILIIPTPELLDYYNQSFSNSTCNILFSIKGLKCQGCSQRLKSSLASISKIHSVAVAFERAEFNVAVSEYQSDLIKTIKESVATLDFTYVIDVIRNECE